MNDDDREAIIRLYEGRFAEMGRDVRSLGWKSVEDQLLRFQVLADIDDLNGRSVCDVGCGFGDLLPYLRRRFGAVHYEGVDITPSFVEKASELHPGVTFHCLDITKDALERRFDYFLLSGALNFRVPDNEAWTRAMLRTMWDLSDRGVAVNFLTSYVNFERPQNYHHQPGEVLAWARELTRWATIRHDYPLWEFTLFMYREPRGLREPFHDAERPV